MCAIEIDLGHSAWQAPVLVQLPKPSSSILATIALARRAPSTRPCGSLASDDTRAATKSMAEPFLHVAAQAPAADPLPEPLPPVSFDDFCKVELRVAEVRACENLKESKKLLHLTVFDGERERCILSGIAKWFKPEDLIGKKLGIVCNLAPRPMMKGKYVSEGMIFAADTADGGCSIPFYSDDTPVGARIH